MAIPLSVNNFYTWDFYYLLNFPYCGYVTFKSLISSQ